MGCRVQSITFPVNCPLLPINYPLLQVEMWVVAQCAVPNVVPGASIVPGEKILVEVSRKYTVGGVRGLAHKAGFMVEVRLNPKT